MTRDGYFLIGWPTGWSEDVARSTWVEGRDAIATVEEATERAEAWIAFRDDACVQIIDVRTRPSPVVRTVYADRHEDHPPPPTWQEDFYRWLTWWKRRGA
ncbi:MAG: hypothetical protein AAGE98_14875 [Actinomycetota bacterium]